MLRIWNRRSPPNDQQMWRIPLIAVLGFLQSPSAHSPADSGAIRIQSYVSRFAQDTDFAGALLVARQGIVLLKRSYGFANYSLRVPNTTKTRFRIASVSKQFTAAAILILQERGALSIDDHLARFVPEFPHADSIAIRHLLTHTSGLGADIGDLVPNGCAPHTMEELVALFRDVPLATPPGSAFHYSNMGYSLLALVIERASGQLYDRFLHDQLFSPLGMRDTGVDDGVSIVQGLASGYEAGSGAGVVENAACDDLSNAVGSGSVYSTVGDLFTWAEALRTGRVLTARSRGMMLTPYMNDYGLGISVRKRGDHAVWEHNGRSPGFAADLSIYPSSGLVTVLLGNLASGAVDEMRVNIPAVALGESHRDPENRRYVATPARATRFVGRYAFAPDAVLTVVQRGGPLAVKYNGTPFSALSALSDTAFFVRAFYALVVFHQDSSGKVSSLDWIQGGDTTRAVRLKSTLEH